MKKENVMPYNHVNTTLQIDDESLGDEIRGFHETVATRRASVGGDNPAAGII